MVDKETVSRLRSGEMDKSSKSYFGISESRIKNIWGKVIEYYCGMYVHTLHSTTVIMPIFHHTNNTYGSTILYIVYDCSAC